jgi:cytochrome c556
MQTRVLVGLAVLAAVGVSATGIAVGQDVIAQRKELMKQVGAAAKSSTQMVKGEKPYDAKEAEGSMSTIAKHWVVFAKLFPDNSKTGGDTTAAAKIWEDPKGFEQRGAKMAKEAEAAAASAANGAEAFKTSFGDVAKNCKGCHDEYRVPKK